MALAASEEAGNPDPTSGDDDGDDMGDGSGETVDPVTGEIVMTWPRWTQATLPGFATAPANDLEAEEEPATVRGMAWTAEG